MEPEESVTETGEEAAAGGKAKGLTGMLQGYRQILKDATFARLAIMRTFSLVGVWAANVVLVAFAYEILQVGHFGYGLLSSAIGAGTILGSLSSGWLSKRGQPFGRMAIAAGVIALCLSAGALAQSPIQAYAMFFLTGLGIGVYNVNAVLVLQTSVSNEYLGRAAAGMQIVDQLIVLLALGASGLVADAFGIRTVMVAGALIIGLSGLIGLVKRRTETATEQTSTPTADSDQGLRVKRVDLTVHDSSRRGTREGVAAVMDEGENSIIIGYDGK